MQHQNDFTEWVHTRRSCWVRKKCNRTQGQGRDSFVLLPSCLARCEVRCNTASASSSVAIRHASGPCLSRSKWSRLTRKENTRTRIFFFVGVNKSKILLLGIPHCHMQPHIFENLYHILCDVVLEFCGLFCGLDFRIFLQLGCRPFFRAFHFLTIR